MSRVLPTTQAQRELFPKTLDDLLAQDHAVRFVRAFVDSLGDTKSLKSRGFRISEGVTGRPHFSEPMLLAVWIYGLMRGLRSCTELEQGCREMLPLMWLSGDHKPDRVTLWRFKKQNEDAMKAILTHSIRIANNLGLIGLVLQAVDGTKIHAYASDETTWRKKSKIEQLEKIDEAVSKILEETANANRSPRGDRSQSLPEKLQDMLALRDKVQMELLSLEHEGLEQMNPAEPEARPMKVRRGGIQLVHNAQAVVDDLAQIITHAEVTNEATDDRQLVRQIEGAEARVGAKTELTLADAGYHNAAQLGLAASQGHQVLVAEQGNRKREDETYASHNFVYDRTRDEMICPEGKTLTLESDRLRYGNRRVREFRCHQWRSCPVAALCSKDRRGRSVEISEHHERVEANRQKLNSAEGMQLMKARAIVVEPVFGSIKERFGRRFRWIGLRAVNAEWQFWCSVHNLKKLFRYGLDWIRQSGESWSEVLEAAI